MHIAIQMNLKNVYIGQKKKKPVMKKQIPNEIEE